MIFRQIGKITVLPDGKLMLQDFHLEGEPGDHPELCQAMLDELLKIAKAIQSSAHCAVRSCELSTAELLLMASDGCGRRSAVKMLAQAEIKRRK